jgi:hypothetical protein
MADFCNQCAADTGTPIDSRDDLKGLVTKSQFEGGLAARAYCEGCGPTFVDHTGSCISKCCEKRHGDY